MQDFKISRFVHHTKEYVKAVARRAIYSGTDAGMKLAGNVLTLLIVISLLPFATFLLLLAGVYGIDAWLELGLGWSFLIAAGVLILLVVIILLLRKVIVRAVCNIFYRKMYDTLTRIDDKLRPKAMPSEEQQDEPTESTEEMTSQTR